MRYVCLLFRTIRGEHLWKTPAEKSQLSTHEPGTWYVFEATPSRAVIDWIHDAKNIFLMIRDRQRGLTDHSILRGILSVLHDW